MAQSPSRQPSRLRILRSESASKSRSRHSSLTRGQDALLFAQDTESLFSPDAPVSEEVAELLQEFVHPHHESEATLAEATETQDGGEDVNWAQGLPWWKRPTAAWFIVTVPLSTIALSGTMASKVQICTQLACEAYKPEYTIGRGAGLPPLVILTGGVPELSPMDDREWALCVHDPVVQAAVARLSLVMITLMGVLSCFTTAWWGSFSDRFGRVRVLSFACIAILITDITFIVAYKYSSSLPGGYWFLLISPLLEGLLGGMATASAAIHAYVADCTAPSSRSRVFSLFIGIMFAGMSLGPTLGSLLIRFTGEILSVFYAATAMQTIYCLFIWFIVPESLSHAQMIENRDIHHQDMEKLKLARSGGGPLAWVSWLFGFLSPFTVFFPSVVDDGSLKKKKRDWNLLLLVSGYGCILTAIGGVPYKFQYMTMSFGWTAEQLGYWSSLVGATRAVHLIVILPIAIKLFKPAPPAIALPTEPAEPLHPSPDSPRSPSPAKSLSESPSHQVHSAKFDLGLARASACIEIVAYVAMILAPSGTIFVAASMIAAFGAGSGPAMSSLAPALFSQKGGKELGKLFGAIGVVQAICSQILGPFAYGMVYMNTVGTFPKAIFLVTIATFVLSCVLFSLIRLRSVADCLPTVEDPVPPAPGMEREETLVDVIPTVIVEDIDQTSKVIDP